VIILAVVAVVLLARIGLARGWPGTERAQRWWSTHRGTVVGWVTAAPATFIYLAILSVTTWVLAGTDSTIAHALLRDQSTNLHHLTQDPVRVLVRSAFWLSSYALLFWAVLFLLVLAPAEHWLGTARWLVVFVSGHVGATLLTAAGIWLAVRSGLAPHRLEDVVDVGVSYGFAAVAAVFTFRLKRPWSVVWAAGLVTAAVLGMFLDGDYTSYGHTAAILIGFALYPITRAPAVRARATLPLLKTPAG
jgi:hypothetical protein